MKKALVLGIGSAQKDIVSLFKEQGFFVHACSYLDFGPAKKYVDVFTLIDITNEEAVTAYARSQQVDLVYSVGSDVALSTIGIVSEQLALPSFINKETAFICVNKERLRSFLGNDFKGNLYYSVFSKENPIFPKDYPVIIKPVDSQGQRGVQLIRSKAEFIKKYKKSLEYSKLKHLIVEEYVEGPEISVNAYLVNSNIVFSLISDRLIFDDFPGGLVCEHRVPSVFEQTSIHEMVDDLVKRTVNKLNLKNGPIYFQIKIKDNAPKLIEVTPRLDGCHLWKLCKEYCGVNLLKVSVDHLMGNTPNISLNKKQNGKQLKLKFLCEKPGKIIDRSSFFIPKDVIYHEWYYENGEIVQQVNGYFERIGYFISCV